MDSEMLATLEPEQRLLHQILDVWVKPEIERRTQLAADAHHPRSQPDRLRQLPECSRESVVRSGRVELPQS